MDGKLVNIRLLDLLLYEFLFYDDEIIEEFLKFMGIKVSDIKKRIVDLDEFNLMFGYRGCRFVIIYFEICVM